MMWKNGFLILAISALLGLPTSWSVAQTVNIPIDSVTICPGVTTTLTATVSGFQEITNYTVSTVAHAPETAGGTNLIMTDDDMQGSFPIGFCFEYLDSAYTDFYICSNGWISFSPNGGGWNGNWSPNVAADIIPSVTGNVPKNAVFGPWVDYLPPSGGTINYQTIGVAPNRKLVVTWSNVQYFNVGNCGGFTGTTQIVLNESSNIIENHLTTSPMCANWGNGAKTQGLHDLNGTNAWVNMGRNGNQWTANNESARYTPIYSPAPPTSVTINWESPLGVFIGTGSSISVSPMVDTWVYAIPDVCGSGIMDSVLIKVGGTGADFTQVDILCEGDSTGSITVIDTAGLAGPLDFYFLNGALDTIQETINSIFTTESMSNLPADSYEIQIYGSDGSCATANVTLTEPTDLIPGVGNLGPTSCNGAFCDGTATGSALGGTPPYQYIWPGGAVGSSTNTLCSGNNVMTVTDANGCFDTIGVPIIEPFPITVNTTGTDTICISNVQNLTAIPSGGSPPYTFSWTDSTTNTVISTNNQVGVDPIVSNAYFVSVSDANGCPGPVSYERVYVREPLMVELDEADTICPTDSIDLETILVSGGDGFYSYQWSAGLGITDSIRVAPLISTNYFVSLTDGCGTPLAIDSVYVQVGGYPDLFVEIQAEPESICLGEHTVIRAKGFGGFGGEPERTYTWSDGFVGPIRLETPDKTTTYEVTVTDMCLSVPGDDIKDVVIGNFPVPSWSTDQRSGCAPLFTDLTLPEVNPEYNYEWNFGDGSASLPTQLEKIPYQYTQPGCYDISLTVTTDIGCVTTATRDCYFEVYPNPIADFVFSPDKPSTANPRVQFRNTSMGYDGSYWEINDPTFVPLNDEDVFEHIFSRDGNFQIKLVAITDEGCTDTLSDRIITVDLEQTFYIPLAFTPNGDDLNDYFGPMGEGIPRDGYSFTIYDRWGRELFSTNDPEVLWNGRDKTGRLVPIDTYPWVIRYRGMDNVMKELTGRVTYAPTE